MSTSETTNDAIPEPRVVPSHFFLQTPLSVLHELFSRCGLTCEYSIISRPTGHCSEFVMQASVANLKATGKGCTKRAAKQAAIVHLLKALFRCTGSKSDNSPGNSSSAGAESFPNSAIDALQKFCDVNQWAAPTYHAVTKSGTDQGEFVVTCVVKNTAVTAELCPQQNVAGSCGREKIETRRFEHGETQGQEASCSRSEEKIECGAAKSTTSDAAKSTTSEMSLDDDSESVDLNEPRNKRSPELRKRGNQVGPTSGEQRNKGKQMLNKEKLAPEDARQWLSTLLLKNMNLNHPNRILNPSNSDYGHFSSNNNHIVCKTTTSSNLRNTAGADVDSTIKKFPISDQAYQFDDIVSSDEAMKSAEELKDPASEPIPKLQPLPANSITMTRSLPEFSPDFMDDAILALPQSLSVENNQVAAQNSESEIDEQESEENFDRTTAGASNEPPFCQAPSCRLATYVPRFSWVESDMVVLERYAWGTSVYMLPRFLAGVVLVVELLLGFLYVCTDHVSSTELLYTLLVLIFLMFLLRAS
uniref:DRBM domain-containing protein n=1 Tax=Strigamia maritima TaxID=126957 RepID=T1JEC5_STRMM